VLYELAEELAGALSLEQVVQATRHFFRNHLGTEAVLLFPDGEGTLVAWPTDVAQTLIVEPHVARTVHDSGEQAVFGGLGSGNDQPWCFPLRGSTRNRGVLAVAAGNMRGALGKENLPLLETVSALVATAVERLHFVEVAHVSQMQMVSERLRSSILSALAHDIRTPLTVLYGTADSLALTRPPLPEPIRETVQAVRDQAFRLSGLVSNLLDMARLQAGKVTLRKEWQPLEEVVGASIKLLGSALADHPVKVSLPADLPLLEFDAVLMERVFCNLLENAAKYSPPGSAIEISARSIGDLVEVSVLDEGKGFPDDKLERVFELFERGTAESTVPGVGLGLAICRAIIDAHGGRIRAVNQPGRGGRVTFFWCAAIRQRPKKDHPWRRTGRELIDTHGSPGRRRSADPALRTQCAGKRSLPRGRSRNHAAGAHRNRHTQARPGHPRSRIAGRRRCAVRRRPARVVGDPGHHSVGAFHRTRQDRSARRGRG
jgi:two-component system sensor histidine kinase KdpD